MKRYLWHVTTILALVSLALASGQVVVGSGTTSWKEELLTVNPSAETDGENLLVNGNLEAQPYYWKYPNHFVAPGWLRWWYGNSIPEYDDTRIARPHYEGEHAQVYFRWGAPYTAGIYQQIQVPPCTYYQFEMVGRNHSLPGANHYARIGLDPQGRLYNDIDTPPISGFPEEVVWSDYQTFYNVWGRHEVVAEANGKYLTAITYVSPEPGYGYYDTFWDAGSLTTAQPPEGYIPGPASMADSDGFITNLVTRTVFNYLVVEWDTSRLASTQVWYHVAPSASSAYTPVVYLPFVSVPTTVGLPAGWSFSFADQARTTHHQAVIGPLQDGDVVRIVALSRRLAGGGCSTSSSNVYQFTIDVTTAPLHSYLPTAYSE